MHLEPNISTAVPGRNVARCSGHVDVGDLFRREIRGCEIDLRKRRTNTLVVDTLVGLEADSGASRHSCGGRRGSALGVVASEVLAAHVGDLPGEETVSKEKRGEMVT